VAYAGHHIKWDCVSKFWQASHLDSFDEYNLEFQKFHL
jgi:hypothetical protein